MSKSLGVSSIVVGGGIAGLVAALELSEKGDSVILLEATGRLGGLISSVKLTGIEVDSGAEAFAVAHPQTLDLIEKLGLTEYVTYPTRSDARVRVNGVTVPIPAGVLGIPASLDDSDLLSLVGAEAVELAKALDSKIWDESASPTIGELVVSRLGQDFLDKLVAPVISGVHASDPMKLEVRAVSPGLLESAVHEGSLIAGVAALRLRAAMPGAAVAGFTGGMHVLVKKLSERLIERGVEIRLNSTVQRIELALNDFEVMVSGAPRLSADRLVVAVPPHIAAELMVSKPELAEILGEIKSVDVAVVALALENQVLTEQPLGSGVLVAEGDPEIIAKASTHSTAKWQWLKGKFPQEVEIVRLSYGRDGVIPVAFEDLIPTALRDAEKLYGLTASNLLDASAVTWPNSLIQSLPGHQALLARLQLQVSKEPGLAIVGAGLGGNGITGIIAKTLEVTSQIGFRNSNDE